MKDFKEIRHNNGIVDDSFGHAKIQPLEISRINNCQKETALEVIEEIEKIVKECKFISPNYSVPILHEDTFLSKLTELKQQLE